MVRLTKDSYSMPTGELGGKVNLLNCDYAVSKKPEPGQEQLGLLAHVPKSVRDKITSCGHGEIDRHLDYIRSKVGGNPYGKKKQTKFEIGQGELEL